MMNRERTRAWGRVGARSIGPGLAAALVGCAGCGSEAELTSLARGRLESGSGVELFLRPSERSFAARVEGEEELRSLSVGVYEDRDGDGSFEEDEQVAGAYVESGVAVRDLETPPLQVADSWRPLGEARLVARLRTGADERWELCWSRDLLPGRDGGGAR